MGPVQRLAFAVLNRVDLSNIHRPIESMQLILAQEIIKPRFTLPWHQILEVDRKRFFNAGLFQAMLSQWSISSVVREPHVLWRIKDRSCYILYSSQDDAGQMPYLAELFERSYTHLYLLLHKRPFLTPLCPPISTDMDDSLQSHSADEERRSRVQ